MSSSLFIRIFAIGCEEGSNDGGANDIIICYFMMGWIYCRTLNHSVIDNDRRWCNKWKLKNYPSTTMTVDSGRKQERIVPFQWNGDIRKFHYSMKCLRVSAGHTNNIHAFTTYSIGNKFSRSVQLKRIRCERFKWVPMKILSAVTWSGRL